MVISVLRTLTFAMLLAVGVASSAQAKTYLISDNDDTLQISAIRESWYSVIYDTVYKDQAFAGSSFLYNVLAIEGVQVAYVSGSLFYPVTERFLKKNKFPNFKNLDHKIDPVESTEDYKVRVIEQMMTETFKTDPEAKFIFLGDNGQQDPLSYGRITADAKFQSAVLKTYIHQLYDSSIATPLQKGQIGYCTYDQVAQDLSTLGLVNQTQVAQIKALVLKSPRLAYPPFARQASECTSMVIGTEN